MLLNYLPPSGITAAVLALLLSFLYARFSKLKNDDGSPAEPPALPSWIPWIGHGIALMHNSNGVFEAAIKRFGSGRPFTLRIAGKKMYVFTAPEDVREMFKRSKELSFDPFAESVMVNVYKIKEDDREKLHVGGQGGAGSKLVTETHNFYLKYLYPGTHLDDLKARYVAELDETLDGIEFPQEGVDLYRWACTIVITATTNAVMGKTFLLQNPLIISALLDFDVEHIYMIYGLPHFLARKGCRGRDLLMKELERYFFSGEAPEHEGTGMMWWSQELLESVHFSRHAIIGQQLSVYWAMQSNSMRTAFWILTHILSSPQLLSELLQEIAPAFTGTSLTSPKYIIDSCPTLTAVYLETLRLASASASARVVMSDTVLNGYLLKAGERVIAPVSQSHFDPTVWGADCMSFDHSRWMDAATTERRMGLCFRPFGGGGALCPGRFFVRVQVLGFVAGVIWRLKMSRRSGEWNAKNLNKPSIGLVEPYGDPVRVLWEKREAGVGCA